MKNLLGFLFLVFVSLVPLCRSTVDVHVGVILDVKSRDSPIGRIGMHALSIAHDDFYSHHADYKTRLVLEVRDSNDSDVDAAAAALNLLKDVKVDAIIGPQKSTQVNFVMDLGDRAHVPIISFSATSPSLIPRTPYFVRTAQGDANQVQAIASIVKAFQWSQVVIVYEHTEFGNGIIPDLYNALQHANARVSYRSRLPKSAKDDLISRELNTMMRMQTRVFIVHASQSLAKKLFLKAKELGMMTEGYAWIVTSLLTDLFTMADSDVVKAMQGVLGVRPVVPTSQQSLSFSDRLIRALLRENQGINPTGTSIFGLWAYDTFYALALAAERAWNPQSSTEKNEHNDKSSDPFALEVSQTSARLLQALLETKFTGLAGDFNLVEGQLERTPYQVVNIVGREERQVGIWTPSGGISKEALPQNFTNTCSASKECFKSITWPGDTTSPPRGWEVPLSGKKLRIGVPQKPGFNEFLKVEVCPQTNAIKVTGYNKEVFEAVIRALPYELPHDYFPYPFFDSNDTSIGNYDGLVHQASLQEHYDAALGDITITANRSMLVDFSLPYAEGGVAGIGPIKYENDVFTFLKPLTWELWLTTAAFYVSTGLAVWIVGRRAVSTRESPGEHSGMIGYFPFFPGQGMQASLLCLILVTWAFVGNLLNSTYTASLSSMLTVAHLQPVVTDVTELIDKGYFVGCQHGSFLFNFLLDLGFHKSKIMTYRTTYNGIKALSLGSKNGGIAAYFDVLPHIKLLEAQSDGKYRMLGPVHRTDGFAFAFPKGSPLVADISQAIVRLMENGTIQDIEKRMGMKSEWPSPNNTNIPTPMTLQSFLALFVISGCVTLTCLIVSQLMHLHETTSIPQRLSNVRASIDLRIRTLGNYLKEMIPLSCPDGG